MTCREDPRRVLTAKGAKIAKIAKGCVGYSDDFGFGTGCDSWQTCPPCGRIFCARCVGFCRPTSCGRPSGTLRFGTIWRGETTSLGQRVVASLQGGGQTPGFRMV